jgi:hypothetical protein
MTARKYSVEEIDRMRDYLIMVVSKDTTYGYPVSCSHGMALLSEQGMKTVEERLRTYMLNGTDPGELESSER